VELFGIEKYTTYVILRHTVYSGFLAQYQITLA